MRVNLREFAEAARFDPKRAILDEIADLDEVEVFHHMVLVATAIESDKTPGGIIKPDDVLAQNRFQGKAALVLKLGPNAFVDDAVSTFGGVTLKPGDWVFARPSDGVEMFIATKSGMGKGVACRLFADRDIMGRLPDPTMIY